MVCRTVIDQYILTRKTERKLIRDVDGYEKIYVFNNIPKLLVSVLDLKEELERTKVKFEKRCKVSKLMEVETFNIG